MDSIIIGSAMAVTRKAAEYKQMLYATIYSSWKWWLYYKPTLKPETMHKSMN